MFSFSDINEAWEHDPVREITNKLSKGNFKSSEHSKIFDFKSVQASCLPKSPDKDTQSISLSDIDSTSLLSNNIVSSDIGSYAPINFSQASKKKRKYHISNDTTDNSRCNYSVKHLKKCDKCYHKLKHLIDTKVNKKFDEIILDNKMKELQNSNNIPPPPVPPVSSWKETLVIIIGAIVAIFIVFLMIRSLGSSSASNGTV